MSAGNPNQPNEAGNEYREPENAPESTDREVEESPVLEELLAETRATTEGKECLDMIVGFCRANSDKVEIDLDLMQGIVKLILAKRFPKRSLPDGCSEWVAEVLFYDPASLTKIQELWQQAHGMIG